ncbi:MAG: hypothetical protein HC789_22365 [Microcoleus sp. CSU_2_2]|nr:hypothetical protein [Microcoleus sp. CSU_2_2]
MKTKIDEKTLSNLPESLQIAQKAIETGEVQEIIKQLAKYNLGVCMPHMHIENKGFVELPKDMIQVERQLVTSFVHSSEVDEKTMIPVVWRYIDGVVVSASSCRMCE